MSEPERLSETGNEVGAELLRSAKRYRVSEESRQRALATTGLAAGASAIGSSKLAWAAASGAKSYLLAFAGALVVAGGYFVIAPKRATHAPPPASVVPAARSTVAVSDPPPVSGDATGARSVIDVPAPSANLPVRSAAPGSGSHRAETGDLAAELHALDGASKAIANGDGMGALTQLDAYQRAFPRGSLSLESNVLRVEALDRAGRHSDAVSAARTFVTRHPTSPLAERMRQIAGK